MKRTGSQSLLFGKQRSTTQATADKRQACPYFARAASVLISESENIPFRPAVEEGKNKSVLKAPRRPGGLGGGRSHCFRL